MPSPSAPHAPPSALELGVFAIPSAADALPRVHALVGKMIIDHVPPDGGGRPFSRRDVLEPAFLRLRLESPAPEKSHRRPARTMHIHQISLRLIHVLNFEVANFLVLAVMVEAAAIPEIDAEPARKHHAASKVTIIDE